MNKVEQIINKINKKAIKLDDIIQLNLTDKEFEIVMEAFKKSGIETEENFEESEFEETRDFSDDIVKQYLEEIGKIPVLTKEEEKELFTKYSTTKDPIIEKKLIESNLKLVVSVAKHYYQQTKITTIDFLDLIQDGNEGLIKAIEKYDVEKGYKFSTYATWWIRQRIARALVSTYKTVRVPVHMEEFINKVVKYINEQNIKTGKKPKIEEICEKFNANEEKVKLALELSNKKIVSLEEKISEDSSVTIMDYVEDETVNIEKTYIAKESCENLREIMKEALSAREYAIISCRYGIVNEVNDCSEPMTLEQIAGKFGVTRERIRQIEMRSFRKLKTKEQGNKIKCLKNN